MIGAIRNIKNAFIFVFITVIFSVAVYFINEQVNKAKETLNWSSVPGIVTYSKIGMEYSTDSDGKRTKMYYPSIKYTYSVNGVDYKGDKYEISKSTTSSQSSVSEITREFTVNKKVNVYYDPIDESIAILKPGVPFVLNLFLYIFGTVVTILWFVIISKIMFIVFGLSLTAAFLSKKNSNIQDSTVQKRKVDVSTHSDDAFDIK